MAPFRLTPGDRALTVKLWVGQIIRSRPAIQRRPFRWAMFDALRKLEGQTSAGVTDYSQKIRIRMNVAIPTAW
jgi:hypothetical protein